MIDPKHSKQFGKLGIFLKNSKNKFAMMEINDRLYFHEIIDELKNNGEIVSKLDVSKGLPDRYFEWIRTQAKDKENIFIYGFSSVIPADDEGRRQWFSSMNMLRERFFELGKNLIFVFETFIVDIFLDVAKDFHSWIGVTFDFTRSSSNIEGMKAVSFTQDSSFNIEPQVARNSIAFLDDMIAKKIDRKEQDKELGGFYFDQAKNYMALGEYSEAIFPAEKGLELSEQVFDLDSTDIAECYYNISMIYFSKGDYESAMSYSLKSIEIQEKVFEPDHPNLAVYYNNISLIYQSKDDYESALNYSLKGIDIKEQVLEPDHPNLAASYNSISTTYHYIGDHESALSYSLKAIKILEQVFESTHPDLATSYNNISMIYRSNGDYVSALNYSFKSIEIKEKILVPTHPDLAASYNNISYILKDLRELKPAREYMKKAIGIMKSKFPEGHPNLNIASKGLKLINQAIEKENHYKKINKQKAMKKKKSKKKGKK